jgi:ATP synthase F1 complex assembly factor 2
MVGLAATKSGSGEKERAYIVRQNSVLKGLLAVVILVCVASMVAFTTIYELSIARRGLIKSEAFHHKKEHHDHEELIRTHLELQQALETTVEETEAIEEVRAYFEKSVGMVDDGMNQLFADSGVKPEVLSRAKMMQRAFIKSMEVQLGKLIQRFQTRTKTAHSKLVHLAKLVGQEVQTDAKENKLYDQKLEQFGVDEKYADELAKEEEEEEQEEMEEEHDNAGKKQEVKDDQDEDATHEIERVLEAFFVKLNDVNMSEVPPEVITQWKDQLEQVTNTLMDPNKEVDLDAAARKMEDLIAQTVKVNPPKFDAKLHDSPVEFFETFIEKVRVVPHKQALLDLYAGWKSPDSEISALTVLANIEQLAEANDLFHLFDWLEVRGLVVCRLTCFPYRVWILTWALTLNMMKGSQRRPRPGDVRCGRCSELCGLLSSAGRRAGGQAVLFEAFLHHTQNTLPPLACKLVRNCPTAACMTSRVVNAPTIAAASTWKGRARFYKLVDIAQRGPAEFGVTLDGRALKTPAQSPLVLPSRPFAKAVAVEWEAQYGHLEPSTMPLTMMAATVLDLGRHRREETITELLRYMVTDIVCFPREHDLALQAKQVDLWGPFVKHCTSRYGPLCIGSGEHLVAPVHPARTMAAVSARLHQLNDWHLHAVHELARGAKSLVVPLAVADRAATVAQAFAAARAEEEHQIAEWGLVEGNHDVDKASLLTQMAAASTMLWLC